MSCLLEGSPVPFKLKSKAETTDTSFARRARNEALLHNFHGRGCWADPAAAVDGCRGPGRKAGTGRWTRAWNPSRRRRFGYAGNKVPGGSLGRLGETWDDNHKTRWSGRNGKSCFRRGAPSALSATQERSAGNRFHIFS